MGRKESRPIVCWAVKVHYEINPPTRNERKSEGETCLSSQKFGNFEQKKNTQRKEKEAKTIKRARTHKHRPRDRPSGSGMLCFLGFIVFPRTSFFLILNSTKFPFFLFLLKKSGISIPILFPQCLQCCSLLPVHNHSLRENFGFSHVFLMLFAFFFFFPSVTKCTLMLQFCYCFC